MPQRKCENVITFEKKWGILCCLVAHLMDVLSLTFPTFSLSLERDFCQWKCWHCRHYHDYENSEPDKLHNYANRLQLVIFHFFFLYFRLKYFCKNSDISRSVDAQKENGNKKMSLSFLRQDKIWTETETTWNVCVSVHSDSSLNMTKKLE